MHHYRILMTIRLRLTMRCLRPPCRPPATALPGLMPPEVPAWRACEPLALCWTNLLFPATASSSFRAKRSWTFATRSGAHNPSLWTTRQTNFPSPIAENDVVLPYATAHGRNVVTITACVIAMIVRVGPTALATKHAATLSVARRRPMHGRSTRRRYCSSCRHICTYARHTVASRALPKRRRCLTTLIL